MKIVLASPWQPRGEASRFERYYPRIQAIYDDVQVAVRPIQHDKANQVMDALDVHYVYYEGWSGRHTVMHLAVKSGADYIHYVDMDRLIRWVETRPDELKETVESLQRVDCQIIGRTEAAYATHPNNLRKTETLPNLFFSSWFERDMDFCAGSKGFSRSAAEFILEHSPDTNSLAMDVAWPILLKRGGFSWDYVAVEGLDWETADRQRDSAATAEMQAALAAEQDKETDLWDMRVRIATEITQLGFAAMKKDL